MSDDFYGSGPSEMLESVKDFARKWSFALLIILVVGIVFCGYCYMTKKENMYNPGATAWFQLGNWKENMIDPNTMNCTAVGTNTIDAEDPYADYARTEMAENMTDRQLAKGLFK